MKSLGSLFLVTVSSSLIAQAVPTLYYKNGSNLLKVAITQPGYVVLSDPDIKNKNSWPRAQLGGGFMVRDNPSDGGKLSDILINRVNQSCEIENGIRVRIGDYGAGREYWGADAVAISASGSSSTSANESSRTLISSTQFGGVAIDSTRQNSSTTRGETKVAASQEKIYRLRYVCQVKSKVPISNVIGILQCGDGSGKYFGYAIWIGPLEADKTIPINISLPLSKQLGEGGIKFDRFYLFSNNTNYPCVDIDMQ